MRNFMIDVWVWTKGKHSRPLKTIQFQQENFPTKEECECLEMRMYSFIHSRIWKFPITMFVNINFNKIKKGDLNSRSPFFDYGL